jgi:hypothetical protein
MPTNDLIRYGQEMLIQTCGALDPGLLAQTRRPFITTSGCISGLTRLAMLEAASIDIVSTAKERAKQRDLGLGRGQVMDKSLVLVSGDASWFRHFSHQMASSSTNQSVASVEYAPARVPPSGEFFIISVMCTTNPTTPQAGSQSQRLLGIAENRHSSSAAWCECMTRGLSSVWSSNRRPRSYLASGRRECPARHCHRCPLGLCWPASYIKISQHQGLFRLG